LPDRLYKVLAEFHCLSIRQHIQNHCPLSFIRSIIPSLQNAYLQGW
jgi:hypothetical protein